MKNLARIIFCTIVIISFSSCEPEELAQEEKIMPQDPRGDTGDQEDVYPEKD